MKKLVIGDKTYILSEYDLALTSELLAWAQTQLPDPVLALKDSIGYFAPDVQAILIREALQLKRTPKTLDSAEVQALVKTPEGVKQTMYLLYKKHNPSITPDEAFAIHMQAVDAYGPNYLESLPNA